MNTIQTSGVKKTIYYCNCTSVPILVTKYIRHHNSPPTEPIKGGKVKQTNTCLPNTYRRSKLLKLSQHPIGQDSLLIYPHYYAP